MSEYPNNIHLHAEFSQEDFDAWVESREPRFFGPMWWNSNEYVLFHRALSEFLSPRFDCDVSLLTVVYKNQTLDLELETSCSEFRVLTFALPGWVHEYAGLTMNEYAARRGITLA
jgi:hypothetical protein